MSSEFSQAELDAFGRAWSERPILTHMGLRMSFPDRASIQIDLPVVAGWHRGGKGTDAINGGVLAYMFDFALGASALLAPPLRRNATVQLNLNFERAVRGNSCRAVARVTRAARTLLFSSADMFDERGDICARATGLVSVGGPPVTLLEWQGALS